MKRPPTPEEINLLFEHMEFASGTDRVWVKQFLQSPLDFFNATKDGTGIIHYLADCVPLDMIEECLKAGVDVNVPNMRGEAALEWLFLNEEVEKIELLLRYGAQMDVPCKKYPTLTLADYARENAILSQLPEIKSRLEARDLNQATAQALSPPKGPRL